jgi:hypothetical protein
MLEMGSEACDSRSGRTLWYSVFQALENERCLDLHIRATLTGLQNHDIIPNYKVLKQLALRERLGMLYRSFIAMALIIIPILALFQWILALFVSAIRTRGESGVTLHIVPSVQANISLIEAALRTDLNLKEQLHDHIILATGHLSGKVGLIGVMHCIASHMRLFFRILRMDGRSRLDLLLHSRDAFVLLMLVCYAQRHPGHVFVTDDHYQRWAFLLSHNCRDFRIVQHGFLDSNIAFAHSFGIVQTLYVCDSIFLPEFATYYNVLECRFFSPITNLTPNPYSEVGLFLASSFPSIDDEIELLKQIKAHRDVSVIVKFHPAHLYNSQKVRLAALASYVCTDNENPMCKVFISHNSFMEFTYKACGIPTFSIIRSGGPSKAAQAILAFFDQASP